MEQSAFSVMNARKPAPPKHYIRGKTHIMKLAYAAYGMLCRLAEMLWKCGTAGCQEMLIVPEK